MKIEKPQPRQRPAGVTEFIVQIDVPALTIGEFYSEIVRLLEEVEKESPGELFVGKPGNQIQEDYYWSGGGQIVAVYDLKSAKKALNLVITQGEGAWNLGEVVWQQNLVSPFKWDITIVSAKSFINIDTRLQMIQMDLLLATK